MFTVVLLMCLCLSSSAGVGGYFYTTGKKEEEIIEATGENFELKYQEAVRALEAEKQANLQVEVAKTDLEKAQEQLAIAKLEFEGFEFEDDEARQRARTKVFEAEKAAEEAISRLDEAETYAEKAAVDRDVAEKNADSALEVAITNATAAVTKAEGEAAARLIAAESRLEEAKLDAETAIEAAQAYADDVLMRGEADRKKIIDDANARLAAATSDAEAAEIRREIDKADRDWAEEKEGILADLDTQIETANEDLSEAQAAVNTANVELTTAQAARDAAIDAETAALIAVSEATSMAASIVAGATAATRIVRGYKHHNLTGEMLEMTTSGNEKGAVGNDQMSSLYVPTGMWAQLFEHHDYGGWCKAYGPGTHNLASRENDDMTSYKIGTGGVPACPSSSSGGRGRGGRGRSDPKLKDGIKKIGVYEGLNVYEWTWNDIAMTTYGLKGREVGFLTTELDPKYVGKDQYGYEYIKDGTKISEAVKTVRATMK